MNGRESHYYAELDFGAGWNAMGIWISKLTERCIWPLVAAYVLMFSFLIGFYWRSQLKEIMCAGGSEHCWRSWIDASSGWAAAFAALAPLWILYRQFREAQRQTDFLIGEAPPTISLVSRTGGLSACRVRVTNWNRFPVELNRIQVAATFDITVSPHLNVLDPQMSITEGRIDATGRLAGISWIPAFMDRSSTPNYLDIEVVIVPNRDREFEVFAPMSITLGATIHGSRPQETNLELSSTAQHLIAYQAITVREEDDVLIATIERR